MLILFLKGCSKDSVNQYRKQGSLIPKKMMFSVEAFQQSENNLKEKESVRRFDRKFENGYSIFL